MGKATKAAAPAADQTDETKPDETEANKPTMATGRQTDTEAQLEHAENAPTGDDGMPEHTEEDLEALKGPRFQHSDPGHAVDVEVDPKEAGENHADWYEGREPNDVVEVAGQRETVEARMARNGQSAPERAVGASTL